MSAVRMCDRCGLVFSENAEGWSTFSGTTRRVIDGQPRQVTQNMDLCPPCVNASTTAPNPYALTAPAPQTAPDAAAAANAATVAATRPGGYQPDTTTKYPR